MAAQERHIERIRRLRTLVESTRLHMDQFGSRTTLGEHLAHIVAALAVLQGERITPAELAYRSGQSPQNISRWIEKDDNLRLRDHPEDGRSRIIDFIEPSVLEEYTDALIRLDDEHA